MLLIDAVLMNADADGMLTRGKTKRGEKKAFVLYARSLSSAALDFD
jgi:hypothetical protein